MALAEQVDLALLPTFRRRALMAGVEAAVAISNEGSSGDSRVDGLRKALATNLLSAPLDYEERLAWAVAQNPAVTFTSSDGDIQFTVASVWNALAGV